MEKELPLKIKAIRSKANLSQERFGKKIGISGKTISAYETGRCTPPLRILENIADIYDTPLVVLKKEKKGALKEKIGSIQQLLDELSVVLESGSS